MFPLGEVYAGILYILVPVDQWRLMIVLGSIPPFIFLTIAWFMLLESPIFLAQHGRFDECYKVLNRGSVPIPVDKQNQI